MEAHRAAAVVWDVALLLLVLSWLAGAAVRAARGDWSFVAYGAVAVAACVAWALGARAWQALAARHPRLGRLERPMAVLVVLLAALGLAVFAVVVGAWPVLLAPAAVLGLAGWGYRVSERTPSRGSRRTRTLI